MGCMCAKSVPVSDSDVARAGIQNKVYDGPKPVLYYMNASPPSRAALVTARQIGLDVDIHRVNMLAGEHLSPDFVKLNPEHTLPTLDDNGFILWESRAICTYLANRYGASDDFYPKDEKKRAVVDRRLYFDATTLYAAIANLVIPLIKKTETEPSELKKKKILAAMQLLDTFLADSPWVAGDNLTVADTVIVSSVTSAQAIGVELSQYPSVSAWLERCRNHMKGFEENAEGAQVYGQLVQGILGGKPAFP